MSVKLYPQPRSAELTGGECVIPACFKLCFDYRADREMFDIVNLLRESYVKRTGSSFYPVPDRQGKLDINVFLRRIEGMGSEEYRIRVDSVSAEISYTEHPGAFYGLQSFISLVINYSGKIPCMNLHDAPSIPNRGFLLDVSRSRVPKLESVYRFVDILSLLRYNQLQLYMETPVVELPDFPEYAAETEAFTPFEIMQLDNYCRRRYITLIPNHNSFGHLHVYLRKPELRSISALPNGYALDPDNPGSVKFLSRLYDSLLPCFSADTFNVGCDEVSELDREGSRTKERCDRDGGIEPLFLQQVKNIYGLVSARGKKMMMWADILSLHPSIIGKLPTDIIPLIWGYHENTDFDSVDKMMKEAGFGFYNVCGTSSWARVMPDNDKAVKNIDRAVDACVENEGLGVILSDWGDAGHCQPLILSYITTAYAAGRCWNTTSSENYAGAAEWVDSHVFRVVDESMSEIILQAGRLAPDCGNCTVAFVELLTGATDYVSESLPEDEMRAAEIKINEYAAKVAALRMECDDAEICREEFISSAEVFCILMDIILLKYELRDKGAIPGWEDKLCGIERRIRSAKIRYRKVWAERCRINGWYGFWWFIDRHMLRLRDVFCGGNLEESRKPLYTYIFEEPDDNIK